MIQLTLEQKEKNKELRHTIIECIMDIQDTKSLEFVCSMARLRLKEEYREHILGLDEFIGLIDIKEISKIYKMFAEDEETYLAKAQVLELCKHAIDRYIQFRGSISELMEDMV